VNDQKRKITVDCGAEVTSDRKVKKKETNDEMAFVCFRCPGHVLHGDNHFMRLAHVLLTNTTIPVTPDAYQPPLAVIR
jgi:hypothetical protein